MKSRRNRTWISLPKGVARSGCSRAKLLALGVEGAVEVKAFGGRVFVTVESIDALLACETDTASTAEGAAR
jgi:hypothetical protein